MAEDLRRVLAEIDAASDEPEGEAFLSPREFGILGNWDILRAALMFGPTPTEMELELLKTQSALESALLREGVALETLREAVALVGASYADSLWVRRAEVLLAEPVAAEAEDAPDPEDAWGIPPSRR